MDVCAAGRGLGSRKQSTSESLLGLRARGVFEMLNVLHFSMRRWWWKKQQDISGYLWTFGASKQVYLISSQRCICHIRGDYRDLLQGSVCQTLEQSIATWTQHFWSESSITAVPEVLGCCWMAWHFAAVCVSLGTLCWGGCSALRPMLFTHTMSWHWFIWRQESCLAAPLCPVVRMPFGGCSKLFIP